MTRTTATDDTVPLDASNPYEQLVEEQLGKSLRAAKQASIKAVKAARASARSSLEQAMKRITEAPATGQLPAADKVAQDAVEQSLKAVQKSVQDAMDSIEATLTAALQILSKADGSAAANAPAGATSQGETPST